MRDEHAKQQVVEMKICDITLYCWTAASLGFSIILSARQRAFAARKTFEGRRGAERTFSRHFFESWVGGGFLESRVSFCHFTRKRQLCLEVTWMKSSHSD